jgi:hypothetical protein
MMTQVVPVQVDLPQLGAIDACTWLRALRVVAIGATHGRPLDR